MDKQVAWAPTQKEPGVFLAAVLCAPTQALDRDLFLGLLADRIQGLVDASRNPPEAAERLRRNLWEAGLYQDEASVPPGSAGNQLVWSNPAIRERLEANGALPDREAKPVEMLAARMQIVADQADPTDRLEVWAALMARLP